VERMDGQTTELARAMIHDHASALGRHLVELRRELGPFLSDAFPAAVSQPYPKFGPISEGDANAAFLPIFEDVRALDGIVQVLFAGSGKAPTVDEGVARMSALLARSETALGDFEVLSAHRFDRAPRRASGGVGNRRRVP